MSKLTNKTLIKIPDILRCIGVEGLIVCNINESISLWQEKKSGTITHGYKITGIITNIDNTIDIVDGKLIQRRCITVKLDDDSKKQIEYFNNLTAEDSENLIKHYEEIFAEEEKTNDNAIVK